MQRAGSGARLDQSRWPTAQADGFTKAALLASGA
jgi:hypothetical protein